MESVFGPRGAREGAVNISGQRLGNNAVEMSKWYKFSFATHIFLFSAF